MMSGDFEDEDSIYNDFAEIIRNLEFNQQAFENLNDDLLGNHKAEVNKTNNIINPARDKSEISEKLIRKDNKLDHFLEF